MTNLANSSVLGQLGHLARVLSFKVDGRSSRRATDGATGSAIVRCVPFRGRQTCCKPETANPSNRCQTGWSVRQSASIIPFAFERSLPMSGLRLVLFVLTACVSLLAWRPAIVAASEEVTARARQFLQDHTKKLEPLEVAGAIAWWDANTSGKDEDFKKKIDAQNKIDAALSDKAAFTKVKELKDAAKDIDDPVLRRAIEVLYLAYLEKQVVPDLLKKMVELSNAVEKNFNSFRANVDAREMTDSQVRKVLKESIDTKQRKAVWEASKKVGEKVEKELKELVKLRNEAATKLGFKNYHALMLFLNEQDGENIVKLFDELDDLTREPFKAAKEEIDAQLAKRYKTEVGALMPWHYHDPFFQETPSVFTADIDAPFKKADISKLCQNFYAGIGLPIDRVLANSDLYERPGKSPHAFCTDINRKGDVRVLANVVPNAYWAATMLHELGHSVYSTNTDNIPASLPYVLRWEAHILTTEGVAMMFERLAKNAQFLERMEMGIKNLTAYDETASKMLRYHLLIFSRWCQVMLRFEKGMYENPDQDLNKLWWDLVEKYQMLKRPMGRNAPDYASKIHIVTSPVYYHNYMMGELFASQLHHAIAREVYAGADPSTVVYVNNRKVGEFMRKKVFQPGRTKSWDDLTEFATGEKLSAKAFAEDFKAK
jgi:peptidyl-dipeptidase A